jgi:hypothetical protein
MYRILQQIPDSKALPTTPVPLSVAANRTLYFPTSSPPDPTTLQSTNQAFLAEIFNTDIATLIKTQVRRLTSMTERLQVDVTILQKEMKEVKEVHGQRKERQSGKHITLKDRPVVSSEEVAKALEASEKATKAKKKAAIRNRRKKAVSSDEDVSSSASDTSDSSDDSEVEMLDCIEVI